VPIVPVFGTRGTEGGAVVADASQPGQPESPATRSRLESGAGLASAAPLRAPQFAVAGQIIGRRKTVFAAVPVAVVRPNPRQPRQHFDAESLNELAESIRARGLLQPIIVRRDQEGGYTLIAGERRLRAAEIAGIGLVPAILSDDDLLEVALEENLQREDLTPIEEAEALAALAMERGHSHASLAEVIHKSRPYVSNTLTLTRLPIDIKQDYLNDGALVPREIMIAVARQPTPEAMRALWHRVKLQQMSVKTFREREAEKPEPAPGKQLLRAARRLNRALKRADLDALGELETARLIRVLSKTQQRVAASLASLRGRSRGPGSDGNPAGGSRSGRGRGGGLIPLVARPARREGSALGPGC